MARQKMKWAFWAGAVVVGVGLFAAHGCYNTPVNVSEYASGPAPSRMPSPAKEAEGDCGYEESLTGGKVFTMYCASCHSARSLAERPFANSKNVMAHMRVRANLTGKEYAKLMEFLRRWNDIPPPTPEPAPSPSRLIFSQPLSELRPEEPKPEAPSAPPKPPGDAAGQKPAPQP